MKNISVKKFARKFVKMNKEENLDDVEGRLKEALKRKNAGEKCAVCGEPIWALGSAVGGFEGCFTCITGGTDDSEDFEVI